MSRAKTVILLTGVLGLALLSGAVSCSKDEGLKIKRIEPKEGPYGGGDPVTIYGSGFQEGAAKGVDVYFGNKKARIRGFEGSEKLMVETPGGTKDQTVDIKLIFPDSRTAVFKNAYKYIDATAGFGVDELTKDKESEEEAE